MRSCGNSSTRRNGTTASYKVRRGPPEPERESVPNARGDRQGQATGSVKRESVKTRAGVDLRPKAGNRRLGFRDRRPKETSGGLFLPPRHDHIHGMAKTLSVIAQKGGSGKTTLAVAHGKAGGLPLCDGPRPAGLGDDMEAVAARAHGPPGGDPGASPPACSGWSTRLCPPAPAARGAGGPCTRLHFRTDRPGETESAFAGPPRSNAIYRWTMETKT